MAVDDYCRNEINIRAEAAIRRAGVAGVFPTPLEEIAAVAADIREIIDVSDIPPDMSKRRPRSLSAILGAIGFASRTIFIDEDQPLGRARWTLGHEIGHGIIPWHEEIAYFDDHARLFRDSHGQVEEQANLAAAHLLFQGHRFVELSRNYRHTLATPMALARDVGTSLHAAIRYYAESHPDPTGLVVTGRLTRRDGTVPIYTAVESESFRNRFGRVSSILGNTSLTVVEDRGANGSLAAAVEQARTSVGEATRRARLRDVDREPQPVKIQAFDNQHVLFIMLTPRRLVKVGRKVRIASAAT